MEGKVGVICGIMKQAHIHECCFLCLAFWEKPAILDLLIMYEYNWLFTFVTYTPMAESKTREEKG